MTIISAAQLFKKMQNLILLLLGDQTLYFITGEKDGLNQKKNDYVMQCTRSSQIYEHFVNLYFRRFDLKENYTQQLLLSFVRM